MSNPVTKNLRDGSIKIFDGSTPPERVDVACDEGNFTYTEHPKEAKEISDRGGLSHLREGDEVPVDWSFGVKFREFLSQGSNPITPHEAMMRRGAAAAWVTTNDDGGDVATIDLELTIATPTSGEVPQSVLLKKCYNIQEEFAEGDEYNTLAFSGKAFVAAPTITADVGTLTPTP